MATDFLSQFKSYFTEDERNTELYKIWSAIGVNTEKAILEEQNKVNAEFTDINNFSETTLRSWLAYFLQKIPYRTSCTTQVTVRVPEGHNNVEIPKYALLNNNGINYVQMEKLILSSGETRTFTAVQGLRVTQQAKYNNLIKLSATDVDLSYLTVELNGESIPEVSFQTSYDNLSFRGSWKPQNMSDKTFGGTPFLNNDAFGLTKGIAYSVESGGSARFTEDGIETSFNVGDLVVYDGNSWIKFSEDNNLNPIQFANTYAIPSNGYFAYYYDGNLYIKIFQGNEVNNPEGQIFTISYIKSDGVQGQIVSNCLRYTSVYRDGDGENVELELENTASTSGANEPSVGKLGLYLKQRLYCSVNLSSVPEYTTWFKAQPEIGDALILSDYEKWIRNGKRDSLKATGVVSVYLLGNDGKAIDDSLWNTLLERIEPHKDIAVLELADFTEVKQHLKFEYSSSTNAPLFEQFVLNQAEKYYDMFSLQSTSDSLFSDLDLALVIKNIQQNCPYDSTGLIVKGYHYYEETVHNTSNVQINTYADDEPGKGYYFITYTDSTGNEVTKKLTEDINLNGTCYIYDENDKKSYVGIHNKDYVQMNLGKYNTDEIKLECYWGVSHDGILPVGLENGVRVKKSIEIEKVK